MNRYINATKLFNNVGRIIPKNQQQHDDIGMFMNMITNSKTENVISKKLVLEMLFKINNEVEDGNCFQYHEWLEYVKELRG